VFDLILVRRHGWFDAVDARGLVGDWLSSGDEAGNNVALAVCQSMADHRGDRVAELLATYATEPDPRPARAAEALPFAPDADSDALFGLRLRLIRGGHYRHRFLTAERLAARFPGRCIELLAAFLEAPIVGDEATRRNRRTDVPHWIPQHEVGHLQKVADAMPDQFWERLLPHIIRVIEASREDRPGSAPPPPFYPDRTWPNEGRRNRYDQNVELLQIVARAGAALAGRDAAAFVNAYRQWLDHPALSVQHTVGLAFAAAGPAAADVAIGWLCALPARFSLPDERGNRWGIARQIISKHAPHCAEELYRQLEAQVLRHHDPDERRSIDYQVACVEGGQPLEPNWMGLTQHALLPSFPHDRMSDYARSERGVLERKFQRPADAFVPHRLGQVRSLVGPITSSRAASMTDDGWLRIVNSVTDPRRRRHRNVGDKHFTETTPEAFSERLGPQARRDPARFAALALRIAPTAPPE
jgi:hypothetical protein